MQLIGIVLIFLVLGLAGLWFWQMKNRPAVAAQEIGGVQVFNITIKGAYDPAVLEGKLGRPIRVNFTRRESSDCSRFVNFPDFKIRQELPEGQTVAIELNPTQGGEFKFSCDMGMYQGKLIVK